MNELILLKNTQLFLCINLNRKVTLRTEPISNPTNLLASTQTCNLFQTKTFRLILFSSISIEKD